jgi:hypothetical protein
MFRDDQRSWFGQIKDLSGEVVGGHRRSQCRAARRARLRIVVEGHIGGRAAAQRLPRMTLLPTALLA